MRKLYRELLKRQASPMTGQPQIMTQMMAQLDAVARDTYWAVGLNADESGHASDDQRLSSEIGEARAIAGVHPSESLSAAGMIFQAVLPVLSEAATRAGMPADQLDVSIKLNQVILHRMAAAADSYVGFLLSKVHRSNSDERKRISRELHDVVAPSLAVAAYSLGADADRRGVTREPSAEDFGAARQAVANAMTTVRAVSAQIRENVTTNGIEAAIGNALASEGLATTSTLTIVGDPDAMPEIYREEVFLIVREGIRNCARHSHANHVSVTLRADPYEVFGRVRDDGRGFVANSAPFTSGMGLDSMKERTALLGGVLTIESGRQTGTTVLVRIPLPPGTQ